MSEYYHANKMHRNGCPKCNGDNARSDALNKYKFRCEDCGLTFP